MHCNTKKARHEQTTVGKPHGGQKKTTKGDHRDVGRIGRRPWSGARPVCTEGVSLNQHPLQRQEKKKSLRDNDLTLLLLCDTINHPPRGKRPSWVGKQRKENNLLLESKPARNHQKTVVPSQREGGNISHYSTECTDLQNTAGRKKSF